MAALGQNGFLAHEPGVDYTIQAASAGYTYSAATGADATTRPQGRNDIVFSIASRRYRLREADGTSYVYPEVAFLAHEQGIDYQAAEIALTYTGGGVVSSRRLHPAQQDTRIYRRSARTYRATSSGTAYTLPEVGHMAHEEGSVIAYSQAASARGFVAGAVRNSSGVGISRTVLAIDRSTGLLLGSTASDGAGAYVIQGVLMSDRVLVIAVPDVGDNANAVVFDNVTPAAA